MDEVVIPFIMDALLFAAKGIAFCVLIYVGCVSVNWTYRKIDDVFHMFWLQLFKVVVIFVAGTIVLVVAVAVFAGLGMVAEGVWPLFAHLTGIPTTLPTGWYSGS